MGDAHKEEGPSSTDASWNNISAPQEELVEPLLAPDKRSRKGSWAITIATLLSLQLGWGLWLTPSDYARLGWIPATGVIAVLTLATIYSGYLLLRLYNAVPGAVLFGDIGEAAAGSRGRSLVYFVVYSLDATRCIILHLAATQSLQHASDKSDCLVCGLIVGVIAIVLGQVRTLSELGWFLTTGTLAQLFALVVVVVKLFMSPLQGASTELVHTGDAAASVVAIMNLIFAYGGQFAYVEIMNSMRQPGRFTSAVSTSTPVMSVAYLALGAIGYWSQGMGVQEIIIFGTGYDTWSRIAAGAILFQALAQYLVNLNVWTHNVLTVLARSRAKRTSSACDVRHAGDHKRLPWLIASVCIVGYSFGISVTLPFFSTLVGLVTSVTYLTCAYTIPCWFTLRLLGDRVSRTEYWVLWGLIPLSIAFSLLGLGSSVWALVNNLGGGAL
ncbi:g2283 [Coccomyxa viridis]|uniref:G2283 protein n=1 Tax=Coccomyxa viridis TaxID=1274662 RepID=A0ABP1FK06_9CHLO